MTTSGTTIFIGNLWGHVQPSWISSLLSVSLQCFFYLIAFVWANHFRTSDLSSNCVCLSALFFALKTKWRQLSISPGLMLRSAWTSNEASRRGAWRLLIFPIFQNLLGGDVKEGVEMRLSAKGTYDASAVLPIRTGFLKTIIHEGQGSNATREAILVVVALPGALVSRFTQLFLQQRQRDLVGRCELIDGDHLFWETATQAPPTGRRPCICLTVAHRLHRAFRVAVPSRRAVGGNGLHLVAF